MCTSFWWMEISNCLFQGLSCTHRQTSYLLGFAIHQNFPAYMADRSPLPAFLSPVRCLWFFLVGCTEQSHGTSEALQKGMGELPYITTLRENCQGGYSTKARGKQRADGHRLSLPPTPSPCPITMTSFATWEK